MKEGQQFRGGTITSASVDSITVLREGVYVFYQKDKVVLEESLLDILENMSVSELTNMTLLSKDRCQEIMDQYKELKNRVRTNRSDYSSVAK